MKRLTTHQFVGMTGMAILLATLAASGPCSASDTIDKGWDLLQTDPGATDLFGQPFEGVPLGTFNFGGSLGVQNVGSTDTLIRRLSVASVAGPGSSATVSTVVDAFQLRSVNEVSLLGGPLGFYYITLQSRSGGPVSAGTMTINFGPEGDPHGTFSSSFDLFVDVRLDSLNGPIIGSREIVLPDSFSSTWRHDPTGPIQIPGVNMDLGGPNSTANDFWIEGEVVKTLPNGSIGATNVGVPDGGNTLFLLALTLAGCALVRTAFRNGARPT